MKVAFLILLYSFAGWGRGLEMLPPTTVSGSGYIYWQMEFVNRLIQHPVDQRTVHGECREIEEIPGTILCMVADIGDVGKFQARASIFSEGAGEVNGQRVSRGTLAERGSLIEKVKLQRIAGSDIRSPELLEFYRQVEFNCDCPRGCNNVNFCSTANICLSDAEREMYEKVIVPAEKSGKPFTVIMSPYLYGVSVSHEVLHAQYFNQPEYRKAIDEFWNDVMTEDERKSVTDILAVGYDRNDSLLIRNEFHAYVFFSGSTPFASLTSTYRDRLSAHLKERGVTPLLIRTE